MARRVNGGIGIGFEEDGYFDDVGGSNGISSSSSSTPSPPRSKHTSAVHSSAGSVSVTPGGSNYILHHISKFDTLAGVAIKYGVEVADIRRMNGLVTDRQMFGLRTLRIPLPGRHPPSPILPNGFDSRGESSSEKNPNRRRHSDLFDTFQSLKLKPSSQQDYSPSIRSLHDYYGLRTVDEKYTSEGFEMAAYRNGGDHYLDDGAVTKPSTLNLPLGLHMKNKSVANGLKSENGDLVGNGSNGDSDKWINRLLVRRRQKSEADFTSYVAPPHQQQPIKEENRGGGTFTDIMFKGLGLPKKVNGFFSGSDGVDSGGSNPTPVGMGESFIYNVVNGFKKSSSTSSLQETDNNNSNTLLSLWPTSKPIFDGIPNPISGRKNKAAVD